MKKVLVLLAVSLLSLSAQTLKAQTLPDIERIPLESSADFDKAEPFVLQTANYVLSSIYVKDSPDRIKGLQFIINWMRRTSRYSFRIDETATKIGKGNEDLIGVYMAAMTKYVIENRDKSTDPDLVKLKAVSHTIDYCSNPVFKMKMTKYLKKLADAREKGELEKLLKEENK